MQKRTSGEREGEVTGMIEPQTSKNFVRRLSFGGRRHNDRLGNFESHWQRGLVAVRRSGPPASNSRMSPSASHARGY